MNEVLESNPNWPAAFMILFFLVGLAMIFHGFPNIRIGGTDNVHNHYNNENEENENY